MSEIRAHAPSWPHRVFGHLVRKTLSDRVGLTPNSELAPVLLNMSYDWCRAVCLIHRTAAPAASSWSGTSCSAR